ncbi:hypothetical protein ES708_08592 [subsurface metagenome]
MIHPEYCQTLMMAIEGMARRLSISHPLKGNESPRISLMMWVNTPIVGSYIHFQA